MSDNIDLKKVSSFKGEITTPPDKSISHRAIMISAISDGRSRIKNFLRAEDTLSTLNAFKKLGIDISEIKDEIIINSRGFRGLKESADIIDCGNSGTTIRLLSGILAGNSFISTLTGDASLRKRPMARVIKPLREMGADITAQADDIYPPIVIRGGKLHSIDYQMPIASAQVKSSILFAGLYASGETSITEPIRSRDHTERMLKTAGADIKVSGLNVKIRGLANNELNPADISVPGDFSSAAFFMVAALLVKNSDLTIKNAGINPTRTGLIDVLRKMGADIELINKKEVSGEPVSDIRCKNSGNLKAVNITKEQIPALIDELPIICIAAAKAEGLTSIRGAEELRVKESDRIRAMSKGLKAMGVEVEEFHDGLNIKGSADMKGAVIESHDDHRIAMAFSIASLAAEEITTIKGVSSVNISFPGFYKELQRLSRNN
ncbi:MAG: 3-phosphoshikimate 1-carboxyvinyltransferase [Nitrospiraceae bacterium]|nr:3-phosphoshikimate 1-carboxyvinyltransferase [Nitrospiraceae bacterium]